MIFNIFVGLVFAVTPCEKITHTHPDYVELQKQVDSKLANASNLVTIASEADQILSKLIAAKSPVLLSWLNKRNLMSQKEEVIAQEWRKYYLQNFIFDRFPSKKSGINTSVENLLKEINQLAFPQSYKEKANKIFSQAKKATKAAILRMTMNESVRKKVIHRIDTIKLFWFEKLLGTRYENKPLEFVKWGVAYDPQFNEINMGVQARKYPTDANLFAVFVHEMGHSIDPCRWSFYVGGPSPFEKVIQCLRSPESVGAKKRDDSKMDWAINKKLLTKEMAESLKQHPTCNRSFYPPEGTQKDQILESFADWFSTEIYANGPYSKSFPRPDLCENNQLMGGSSYINHIDRLTKIYLSHPQLQKQKHSKSITSYCSL